MNDKQRRILQSFRRVQDFLTAHPIAGASAGATRARQALDDAVQRIERHATDQYTARSTGTSDSRRAERLRRALRTTHLRPLAHMARAIVDEHPEVAELTTLPPTSADSEALVAAATSMTELATRHEALLVDSGLPGDFLAGLRAATETLRQATDDRGEAARRRTGASAALQDAIDRGRRAVQLLDTVVETTVRSDPQLLAEWRLASRVTSRQGRPAQATLPAHVMPIAGAQGGAGAEA